MKPADLLIMVVVMLAVTYLGHRLSGSIAIGVAFFKQMDRYLGGRFQQALLLWSVQ